MLKIIASSGIFSVLGECLENVELKTSVQDKHLRNWVTLGKKGKVLWST